MSFLLTTLLTEGGASPTGLISGLVVNHDKIYYNDSLVNMTCSPTLSGSVTSYVWRIRNNDTGVLVGMSTVQNPSFIIQDVGFYDIEIEVKTSTDQVKKYIPNAFKVHYPRFTEGEADIVVDLSSGNYYNNFASADNSGLKIYVKGSGTAGFWCDNLHGSSGNPVRIQKATGNTDITQTIPNGTDGFILLNPRHVWVDGYNDDKTQGWNIVAPTGTNFTIRIPNTGGRTGVHIMGMDLNRTGTSSDRAHISMIPQVNATYNAADWLDENTCIWNCVMTGSGAEGIYVNYTNDTPQTGEIPPKSRYLRICHNIITNTGNDAIQVASSIDSYIQHNLIDTWGIQASQSHENAFSINEGNCRLTISNNFAINGKMGINMKSGLTPWDVFNGETAPDWNAIYANIIIEGTPPGGGVTETVFNYIQTNGSNTAEWPLLFFNNTVICDKIHGAIQFGSGAFTIPNLVWANNVIVKTGNAGDYPELDFTATGTFPTNETVDNLVYEFSDYSGIGFVDGSGDQPEDYKYSSLSSPAYSGAVDISALVSEVPLLDYDGHPLNSGAYTNGAYSGYVEKTVTPAFIDGTAPTFSTALSAENLTDTGGDIQFALSEDGLLLWSIVEDGDTAPTVAQLKAGGFGVTSGSILGLASTLATGSFSGLTVGTAYDLYGVAVNGEGVAQAVPTKVDFNTVSDIVAPTLSGWAVSSANPDRITFNSSEVITASTFGGFSLAGILGTAPTITGIVINSGQTTGHYFTLSGNLYAIDYNTTIAYSGTGSDLQDGATNALASFTATAVTNNISATRINVNITNFANYMSTSGWNDADLAGGVGVKTLDSDLVDSSNSATGYALAITEAFNAADNGVSGGVGTYLNNSNINARGIQVFGTSATGNAGTLRISGMTAGKTFNIVYGLKYAYGAGATGNVNINGAGGLAYSTSDYTEYKQIGVVDVSGNIDLVLTNSNASLGIALTGFIVMIYP